MLPLDDLNSKRARLIRAFEAYREDRVQIASESLRGYTHLVATRKGLFGVNEQEWSLLAYGYFFGITLRPTVRGCDILAFEACDQPYSPTRQGRIISISLQNGKVVASSVLARSFCTRRSPGW